MTNRKAIFSTHDHNEPIRCHHACIIRCLEVFINFYLLIFLEFFYRVWNFMYANNILTCVLQLLGICFVVFVTLCCLPDPGYYRFLHVLDCTPRVNKKTINCFCCSVVFAVETKQSLSNTRFTFQMCKPLWLRLSLLFYLFTPSLLFFHVVILLKNSHKHYYWDREGIQKGSRVTKTTKQIDNDFFVVHVRILFPYITFSTSLCMFEKVIRFNFGM